MHYWEAPPCQGDGDPLIADLPTDPPEARSTRIRVQNPRERRDPVADSKVKTRMEAINRLNTQNIPKTNTKRGLFQWQNSEKSLTPIAGGEMARCPQPQESPP